MEPSAPNVIPFRFLLFVTGSEPTSVMARERLAHLYDEFLRLRKCSVTVVDMLTDFDLALTYNVVLSPTLVVDGPKGRSTIVGNLSDIDRISLTLGCNA